MTASQCHPLASEIGFEAVRQALATAIAEMPIDQPPFGWRWCLQLDNSWKLVEFPVVDAVKHVKTVTNLRVAGKKSAKAAKKRRKSRKAA